MLAWSKRKAAIYDYGKDIIAGSREVEALFCILFHRRKWRRFDCKKTHLVHCQRCGTSWRTPKRWWH